MIPDFGARRFWAHLPLTPVRIWALGRSNREVFRSLQYQARVGYDREPERSGISDY